MEEREQGSLRRNVPSVEPNVNTHGFGQAFTGKVGEKMT